MDPEEDPEVDPEEEPSDIEDDADRSFEPLDAAVTSTLNCMLAPGCWSPTLSGVGCFPDMPSGTSWKSSHRCTRLAWRKAPIVAAMDSVAVFDTMASYLYLYGQQLLVRSMPNNIRLLTPAPSNHFSETYHLFSPPFCIPSKRRNIA